MPTVFEDGPYSSIFFSSDRGEPPHIHVKRERCIVRFWPNPVTLALRRGFPGHELNQIARLIGQHGATLLEAWHEYFGA